MRLGASWGQFVARRKEAGEDGAGHGCGDGWMWAQDPAGAIGRTCSRRTDRRWEQTGFRQQVQQDRQTSDGLNSLLWLRQDRQTDGCGLGGGEMQFG